MTVELLLLLFFYLKQYREIFYPDITFPVGYLRKQDYCFPSFR